MNDLKVCPRCYNGMDGQWPAMSRRDSKTNICPDCGTAEAMEAAGLTSTWEGHTYWEVQDEEVRIDDNG